MIRNTLRVMYIIAALSIPAAFPASAAELVLFESADCAWCQTWHAEIGVIYPKTPESQVAPLRRINVRQDRPEDLAGVRRIVYTPTFVLMENGEEVGRITGYAGEEFFWGLLAVELAKLEQRGRVPTRLSDLPPSPVAKPGDDQ